MTLAAGAAARMLARFAGRLVSMTLSRPANSAIDPNDPVAAPTGSPTSYNCEGYAFAYQRRDIDATRILEGDYQVTILRGSLATLPQPGDQVSIPPPGDTTPKTATVIAVESVTEAFVTLQVRG